MTFDIGDWVYLDISPMKDVMYFENKGKLSPRYVGLYRILRRNGKVSCELNFLLKLVLIHSVFNVSLLRKYVGN